MNSDWTTNVTSTYHAVLLSRQAILGEIKESKDGESQSLSILLARAIAEIDPRLRIAPDPHTPGFCRMFLQRNITEGADTA